MKYFKYPSIDNHYRLSYIEKIRDENKDNKWVVQEKIHGCNFAIIYDKDTNTVLFGKRNGLIENTEKFYNYQKLTPYLTETMLNFSSYFKNRNIIVYGELCGGRYNNVKKENIQKEVDYCDKVVFVVFDVKVDDLFVSFDQVEPLLEKTGFITVPTIGVYCSLEQALSVNHVFSSLLPAKLGMPKHPKNNLCEGVVIKALCSSKRLSAIKKKNPMFSETLVQKDSIKESIYDKYITEQRFNSVKSKFEENAPLHHLAKEMTRDIIEEYSKDINQELNQTKIKRIRKTLSATVFNFIKNKNNL